MYRNTGINTYLKTIVATYNWFSDEHLYSKQHWSDFSRILLIFQERASVMSTTDHRELENEPVQRISQVNSVTPTICEIPVTDFGTQIWVNYWRVD